MADRPTLTQLQRKSLVAALAAHRRGEWLRSRSAGERVTLASLEVRGLLERRAWRGDGINRNSAFEYCPSPLLLAGMGLDRDAASRIQYPA